MALATFAGGCFWCMVKPFDEQPGIKVYYPVIQGDMLKIQHMSKFVVKHQDI